MADEIKVKFSLDTKEAIDKLLRLKGAVAETGESSSLEGLTRNLMSVGIVAGTLGTAFLALKVTMDTVFEAENIKSVNTQFDILTQKAGIATDTLKKGLIEASHGLIDDTDLIQTANKAIVTMGESAARLPEIMDLARKASVVTGKDIQSTFEELTQAISVGNMRALKHMGIIVDSQAAYRAYAKELGVTVEALSDAGKKQAVLNEVLEKGKSQLAGVDESVREANNTWREIQVTFMNVKETVVLAFEKIAGPTVKNFLNGVKSAAQDFKSYMTAEYGSGAEQAEEQTKRLEKTVVDLTDKVKIFEATTKGHGAFVNWIAGGTSELEKARKQLEEAKNKLAEVKAKRDEIVAQEEKKEAVAPVHKSIKEKSIDLEKQFALETKFEADILALKKANAAEIGKLASTEVELEKAFNEQRVLAAAEVAQKIKQIDSQVRLGTMPEAVAAQEKELIQQGLSARIIDITRSEMEAKNKLRQDDLNNILQYSTREEDVETAAALRRTMIEEEINSKISVIRESTVLSEAQKEAQIVTLSEQAAQRINEIENQKAEFLRQIIDNNIKQADGMWDRFQAGAKQSASTARAELTNWAAASQGAVNAFSSNFTSAFTALGQGSIGLGDAMKKAVIGALADIAIQKGALLMTEGFANLALLNPMGGVMVAGGSALVALGGVMKGIAGAGGGGSPAVTGGGGIGGGTTPSPAASSLTTADNRPSVEDSSQPKRSVTLQIQGNYFETEQTRTRLVEIIREASDSTDFKISSVGGGF